MQHHDGQPLAGESAPNADDRKQKRAEQARINGAKSKGPVTAEGKERSSHNALKHSLSTSQTVVLAHESPELYQSWREAFFQRFQPADLVEAQLVLTMCNAQWRLRRCEAEHTALIDWDMRTFDDPRIGAVDVLTREALSVAAISRHRPASPSMLLRYEASAHRAYRNAHRELLALRLHQPVASSQTTEVQLVWRTEDGEVLYETDPAASAIPAAANDASVDLSQDTGNLVPPPPANPPDQPGAPAPILDTQCADEEQNPPDHPGTQPPALDAPSVSEEQSTAPPPAQTEGQQTPPDQPDAPASILDAPAVSEEQSTAPPPAQTEGQQTPADQPDAPASILDAPAVSEEQSTAPPPALNEDQPTIDTLPEIEESEFEESCTGPAHPEAPAPALDAQPATPEASAPESCGNEPAPEDSSQEHTRSTPDPEAVDPSSPPAGRYYVLYLTDEQYHRITAQP